MTTLGDRWDEVANAYEAHAKEPGETTERNLIALARAGHPNAIPIIEGLLEDVTGCPCGADELCADDIDPPTRVRYREALAALLGALKP